MSNSRSRVETLSNHPGADRVGDHLVIDQADWCPGEHPDPNQRREGQTEYLEEYVRCIQCDIEVLSRNELPDECEGGA